MKAARHTLLLAGLLAAVTLQGCARPLSVGSEPSPTYRIAVSNTMPDEMIVSYNDGRGPRLLGAVPAGRVETFVVGGAASPGITISARDSTGTRTFGPAPVQLLLGETVHVRIAP
jgi:hypothetical protein